MTLIDLFRPRYKHSDPSVRAKAAETVGIEIARKLLSEDENEKVRDVAANRVEDLLVRTAKESSSQEGLDALKEIKTKQLIAEIALDAKNVGVRQAALDRVTDQSLMRIIARGTGDLDIRCNALSRLSDKTLVRDLVINDHDGAMRLALLNQLRGDNSTLMQVAINDECWPVRCQAAVFLDSSHRKQLARLIEKAGNTSLEITDDNDFYVKWIGYTDQKWQRKRPTIPGVIFGHSKIGKGMDLDSFELGVDILPRQAAIALVARLTRRLVSILQESCGIADLHNAAILECALQYAEGIPYNDKVNPADPALEWHLRRVNKAPDAWAENEIWKNIAEAVSTAVESIRKQTPALSIFLILALGSYCYCLISGEPGDGSSGKTPPLAKIYEKSAFIDLARLQHALDSIKDPAISPIPPGLFGLTNLSVR